jgi:hypothetical protein
MMLLRRRIILFGRPTATTTADASADATTTATATTDHSVDRPRLLQLLPVMLLLLDAGRQLVPMLLVWMVALYILGRICKI